MPCFDGRERRDQEHADEAVRILCEFARALTRAGITPCEWPVGLPVWWERHKAIDQEYAPQPLTPERVRFEREAARLAAQSKGKP